MLTEHFIASVGVPNNAQLANASKDATIFNYQFQPLLAQEHAFKKSATPPNCLAVSSTHIFAAQGEKAVIHVYSRDKRNQEATVPFTERITCLELACDETVLVLGTGEGRIFLWEITSGRQISTAQAHLQAVTALALDSTGNFLLSASKDSSVHVWSVPGLLSFANDGMQPLSPIHSFTSHRAEVTAIVLGRSAGSANIAVTTSSDQTCLIWDYHTNAVLRTYLLPAAPTCVAIDAAERCVYVGYQDGSIQLLNFYAPAGMSTSIHNVSKQAPAPIQPPPLSLWQPIEHVGATWTTSVSFDGCTLLTGHENGAICAWDVAKNGTSSSLLQAPLPGPVTNLKFLPVTGFTKAQQRRINVPAVVKPKFGAFDNSTGIVPSNYAVNVDFPLGLASRTSSSFRDALCDLSFTSGLLDEGLCELSSWAKGVQPNSSVEQEDSEDFMALDHTTGPYTLSLEEQNTAMKAELEALRRLQKASFDKIEKISLEKKALLQREDKRQARNSGRANGLRNSDIDSDISSSAED